MKITKTPKGSILTRNQWHCVGCADFYDQAELEKGLCKSCRPRAASDTPRTEAVAWPAEGGETHKWVSYDFACGLERELSEAKRALEERTREAIGEEFINDVDRLTQELQRAEAKLSERKTVHEWLNASMIPREEAGKPICLLRRLRIACDRLQQLPMEADDAQAVVAFIAMRTGLRAIEKEGQ